VAVPSELHRPVLSTVETLNPKGWLTR
jgi:hypothetical protein